MSEFDRGYACAISCIVAGHGEGTETREALAAAGLVSRKIAKERGIDPYDLWILDDSFKELEDAEGVNFFLGGREPVARGFNSQCPIL